MKTKEINASEINIREKVVKLCMNIDARLQALSPVKFVLSMLVLSYLIFIPLIPLMLVLPGSTDTVHTISKSIDQFIIELIIAGLVGPVIETFIFQYGIIEILSFYDRFKARKWLVAVISAFIFGLTHTYSVWYIVYAFVLGLLLAYAYFTYKKKSHSAFWIVFWIHCIRNTIACMVMYIL